MAAVVILKMRICWNERWAKKPMIYVTPNPSWNNITVVTTLTGKKICTFTQIIIGLCTNNEKAGGSAVRLLVLITLWNSSYTGATGERWNYINLWWYLYLFFFGSPGSDSHIVVPVIQYLTWFDMEMDVCSALFFQAVDVAADRGYFSTKANQKAQTN